MRPLVQNRHECFTAQLRVPDWMVMVGFAQVLVWAMAMIGATATGATSVALRVIVVMRQSMG
jgi:hypothetical protein